MRTLDEINRLITATETELTALESRRSELLARVALLQHEKVAFSHPVSRPRGCLSQAL